VYAEFERGRLARLQHGKLDEFAIPAKYSGPSNLIDAGGTLWFYERVGKKYAAFEGGRFFEIPSDDAVTLLVPGIANDAWALVARGGGNSTITRAFFLKHLRIGRPPDAFPITTINGIESMAVASDGSVWLGEALWPTLAHFEPKRASFTEFALAGAGRYGWVRDIRRAPDGKLYVLLNDHQVGVIP
jgi:streptogramin lyase